MYGRLVGKRFIARYFLEDVVEHGLHACDYLLACDMEMDPVPGYAFTSWAKGYGDFRPVPDFDTLRVASWQNKTAIVICDVMHETRNELVPLAPRSILRRQVERAAKSGYTAMGASELELYVFKDSYETAAEKGFISIRADRPRDRGLPHPAGHERGVPHRRHPLAPRALRRSRRVVERRMGTGSAGDRTALRRAGRDGRSPRDLQTRREGNRVAARTRRHVHGEVGRALRRIELPHPHEPVGRQGQAFALRWQRAARSRSNAPPSSAGSSAAG